MNCYVMAPCLAEHYFFFDFEIDDVKIKEWLGEDFEKLELLSGDFLFVQEGYKDYGNKPNHLGASVYGEPIYGDCIIVEEANYVKDRVRP